MQKHLQTVNKEKQKLIEEKLKVEDELSLEKSKTPTSKLLALKSDPELNLRSTEDFSRALQEKLGSYPTLTPRKLSHRRTRSKSLIMSQELLSTVKSLQKDEQNQDNNNHKDLSDRPNGLEMEIDNLTIQLEEERNKYNTLEIKYEQSEKDKGNIQIDLLFANEKNRESKKD